LNELSRAVIGAALEVHRALGPGFLESAYESALVIELDEQRLPFSRQVGLDVAYKGRVVGCGRVDLIVARRILVELKAVDALTNTHLAQLMSYLRRTVSWAYSSTSTCDRFDTASAV
jgi:GxxExxY protein